MCVGTEKITRQWKSTLSACLIDALPEQECTEKSSFTRCLGPLESCMHNNTVFELDLERLR